jgi:hypothetical protein
MMGKTERLKSVVGSDKCFLFVIGGYYRQVGSCNPPAKSDKLRSRGKNGGHEMAGASRAVTGARCERVTYQKAHYAILRIVYEL